MGFPKGRASSLVERGVYTPCSQCPGYFYPTGDGTTDTTALFSALSLSVIGFFVLSLAAVGFALVRGAYVEPAGRLGVLSVLVLGLCAFVVLMRGLFGCEIPEPHRVSQKFETASYHSVE